jgi:hypothetical protein
MSAKTKSIEKTTKTSDTPTEECTFGQHKPLAKPQSAVGFAGVQQTAGNLAVQSLLRSGAIQAKLRVSQPGDADEQEADRMAEQVVSSASAGFIQRKCAPCAEGATCPKCEEEEKIQTKEKPGHTPHVDSKAASQITSLWGGGQPLPPSVRGFFEPRFGRDFSQIRIHTGSEAAESSRAIQARAYTSGEDIVFGAGQYAPENAEGKKLLAHELTHVVQQDASRAVGIPVAVVQRQPDSGAPAGDAPKSESPASAPPAEMPATDGMTLAPPPGHEERKAQIAAMKEQLVPQRATRDDLRARLCSVPQVSSAETQAERKTLRDKIRSVEEYMIERLTSQIELIDEALRALRAVMPTVSAPGTPDVPEPLWADLRNLESDRKAAEGERKTLQRARARDEIRDIQEQLDTLDTKDPGRKDLEERKKKLGEFLSGTAEKRAAPGTVGKGTDGRDYVVYVHSVKVGGSPPWRNNNPGNVQRSPSGGDFPGVLGVDQSKHFIFDDSETSGKMGVFLDLQTRRGGPSATLANALRSYIAGSQKEEDLPENKKECAQRGIPPATCVTKEAARTYAPKVTGTAKLPLNKTLGELKPEEQLALVNAILLWEGGTHGAKGVEYTCGDQAAPKEYRDLLGCDE